MSTISNTYVITYNLDEYIKPVPLQSGSHPSPGDIVTATGWGQSDANEGSKGLSQAEWPDVDIFCQFLAIFGNKW